MTASEYTEALSAVVGSTDRAQLRRLNQAIHDRVGALDALLVGQFQCGDRVSFVQRGEKMVGEIKKVNRKRIKVVVHGGTTWNVPAGMLSMEQCVGM